MVYDPNIPQANDLISESQPEILENFSQANVLFGTDHVEFNNATVANRGKHNKSTYLEQSGNPVTALNEAAVYTKDVLGITELFIRRENNGTVIQLTEESGDPVVNNNGQTFLPGGMILKWGRSQTVTNGVEFPFPIAFPNSCFTVIITPCPANTNPATVDDFAYIISPPSTTGFTCNTVRRTGLSAVASVRLNYIAIGF